MFGPPYSYVLLRVVYGQRWSETDAPRALAVYCLYILLLAVNGILEAFVHAVAKSRHVLYPSAGRDCTLFQAARCQSQTLIPLGLVHVLPVIIA